MHDIGNGTVVLPIGGRDFVFDRIRIDDLTELATWANAQLIKAALEAQPDLMPYEKALLIKQIGRTYTINDVAELLEDGDCLLHLLGQAFVKANKGKTHRDFLELLSYSSVAELQSWVDLLAGFGNPDGESLEESDPN